MTFYVGSIWSLHPLSPGFLLGVALENSIPQASSANNVVSHSKAQNSPTALHFLTSAPRNLRICVLKALGLGPFILKQVQTDHGYITAPPLLPLHLGLQPVESNGVGVKELDLSCHIMDLW